jgi:ABC-type glycerol-3-phosphate transport system permease component
MEKRTILIYFILTMFTVFALFPAYWMFITSLRPLSELLNPVPWVFSPTLKYYEQVFTGYYQIDLFDIQVMNSVIISLVTAFFSILVSSFAGYSLARIRFPYSSWVSKMVFFTYLMPPSLLSVAFFEQMHNYGLVNTYASIVIAMVVFTSPYCIWIYKEYVKSIPIEIEEAAIIDGAGRLKTFLTVIFPLSAPVIVALSTYAFLYAWNEYLYVLILTSDSRMFTAPLAIAGLLQSDEIPWGLVSAMSILFSIPPVIFYYLVQKYMIRGLVAGAVKA